MSSSISSPVPPFWSRIGKFFTYPTSSQPIILTMLIGFLLSFSSIGGATGVIIMFTSLLAFTRYAMQVLGSTAKGQEVAPRISLALFKSGYLLPLLLLVSYMVFAYTIYLASEFLGVFLGSLTILMVLYALPASTMVLSSKQSLFQAFNPLTLAKVIRSIGLPYFIIYALLLVLGICQTVLVAAVGVADSLYLLPVQNAVGLYFALLLFNLMGYVIYQYHDNFEVSIDPVYTGADQHHDEHSGFDGELPDDNEQLLAEIESLTAEGKLDQAKVRLSEALNLHHEDLSLHDYYHKFLAENHNYELMIEHAKDIIDLLTHENRNKQASQIIIDCYEQNEVIRPSDPDKYYALAYMLTEMKAYKECVALIHNFHTRHAGHPDIPKLYLLCSKALSDGLQKDNLAIQILNFLHAKYQQHELFGEIRQFRDALTKLPST